LRTTVFGVVHEDAVELEAVASGAGEGVTDEDDGHRYLRL
jgi:hypothetical protein